MTSLSGTKSILLLRSTVGWGGQNHITWWANCKIVLAQEVFVQGNAWLHEKRRVFQWYGARGDDHKKKALTKLREANKLQEDFLAEVVAET